MKLELVVIGEGGHSKVVRDLVNGNKNCTIAAFLDDKYAELVLEKDIFKGPIDSAPMLLKYRKDIRFVVAVGNNKVRKTIVARLGLPEERYISLIHETAVVSPSASIGLGAVIMAHAVVNADAVVGDHAIINTGAIVEHDNRIGDYVHIAPKAALTGGVGVKEGAMIGAGATVIPGKRIGEWAVVGAGATVVSDIPPNSTAVGTPAKIMERV